MRLGPVVIACLALTACTEKARPPPVPSARTDDLWTATAAMPGPRSSHVAVLLADGTVLVVGGTGAQPTLPAVQYSPAANTWTTRAPPSADHILAAGVALSNGKVLVVGGFGSTSVPSELFDPPTNTWTPTGAPLPVRTTTTATVLQSGKVLITGGGLSTALSVELYDPATNTWASAAPLPIARQGHTATLLPSGKVLVAGGLTSAGTITGTTTVYDPATNTWSAAAPMNARAYHSATVLADGRVVVAGGNDDNNSYPAPEIYDPANDTWAPAGSLIVARREHQATLLADGRVLLTGGSNSTASALASVELFTPATHTWALGGPMLAARSGHTATALPGGRVLVTGGAPLTSELYDPTTGISCADAGDCSASQPVCVAGLCCTSSCTGPCVACDLPGRVGTCTLRPAGSTVAACVAYRCDGLGVGCPTSCAIDDQCTSGYFCANGLCKPNGTGTLGLACRQDVQCASGFCVDGTCCATACDGPCQVCVPGGGNCTAAISGSPDPVCNGFVCNGDAGCRTSCAPGGNDCTFENRCVDAGCAPKQPLGAACATNDDCFLAFCSGGRCCDQPCDEFGCGVCPGPDFLCMPAPAGFDAGPACSRYVCSGFNFGCPFFCLNDAGCTPGHFCAAATNTCIADGQGGKGSPCTAFDECFDGLCVDGVCCDSFCGGGDPSDCEACSVAAGAAVDGTCAPVAAGRVCRGGPGPDGGTVATCDAPETCDGTSPLCPGNGFLDAGVVCRPAAGGCDVAETCTGASGQCPSDQKRPAGALCRPATGVCDVPETCSGTTTACPPDVLRGPSFECRSRIGACDLVEWCTGDAGTCPLDLVAPEGEPCGSGLSCSAGVCRPGAKDGGTDGGPSKDGGPSDGGPGGSGGGGGEGPGPNGPRGCGCSGAPVPGIFAVLLLRRRRGRVMARTCTDAPPAER